MENDMKRISILSVVLVLGLIMFTGCSNDDETQLTGIVSGLVTDAETGAPLENVVIVVFDANNNSPTSNIIHSDADGNYNIELPLGSYFIKLAKQGYTRVPVIGISPIPFEIIGGQTFEKPVEMFKSDLTNTGFISGNVSSSNQFQPGALVVAYNGSEGYSSITDQNGDYSIFNVPEGSYSVKAFLVGHNSTEIMATVMIDNETSSTNLQLSSNASGIVSGQISFLATQNLEVDVALTHPGTGETIPGLSTQTSNYNYTISGVPDGEYIGRATYENDTKVVDPDRIIKFGEPLVVVSGSSLELDFDVTGAVKLIGPSNGMSDLQPIEVNSAAPMFEWTPYPSASDYVIEVSNSDGEIIWGGFNTDNDQPAKRITISSDQTSIVYNSDNSALESLEAGKIYRWRVYASKDDVQETSGWKLISVSEDQQGLILVQ
jgi:hypothetical protein